MTEPGFEYLVGLSIKLGEDLTIEGDLEQRLDAAVSASRQCVADLEKLQSVIRGYELTVADHTPVHFEPLDEEQSDEKD